MRFKAWKSLDFSRSGRSFLRETCQHPVNESSGPGRNVRPQLTQRLWPLIKVRGDHLRRGLALERRPSRQRMIKRAAQRIHIRTLIKNRVLKLLGGHVMHTAGHLVFDFRIPSTGESKIDQLPFTGFGLHQIPGLHIPVQPASAMHRSQSCQRLPRQRFKTFQRKRCHGFQRSALQKFHHPKITLPVGARIQQADNVRMPNRAQDFDLSLPLGRRNGGGQALEGHLPARFTIMRRPNHCTTAFGDLFLQFIAVTHDRHRAAIESPLQVFSDLHRSPPLTMRLLSLLLLGALLQTAAAAERQPNIVFCFADDMGRYASLYQKLDGKGTVNDLIKTPNIDRIAREGVLFKNAHVCAPSCTPCRSALLSGQYFWRTGRAAILQGAKWDPKIPAYPLLLKEAGYHIGKSYKVWSPGSPADAPYGEQAHAYEKAGRRVNDFSENVTKMVAGGKTIAAAKQELYDEVAGNFDAFIADRKERQPFCFWYGPTNVHRKWVKGSGAALWGLDPEQLKGKPPAFLPDVPEVREDLASYFGEIMAFDACVGVFLKKLETLGELDNTLFVVSGDHGAPGFPHGKCNLYDFGTHVTLAVRGAGTMGGRVVDDFVNLMDLAPTYLELGGVTPPAVMTGRSLIPVLRSSKSGQVDPARNFVITGRERHVESAREGFLPYPQRALRTPDYLYILNFKPDRMPMGDAGKLDSSAEELTENTHLGFADMDSSPTKAWLIGERNNPLWKQHFDWAFALRPGEELYAIGKDPFEIKNVANDPDYATIRDQMRERLMAELTRTKDPRVENNGAFFETAPMAGPLPDDIAKPKRGKGPGKKK